MSESRFSRWASPSVFAGILIAFLLPFATVSCNGEEVSFTGAQLAFSRVPEETQIAHGSLAEDVEAESSAGALIALAAAVAGFALGVARRRGGGIAAAGGLAGMSMLAWNALTTMATVELHAGFALALLGFVAAAAGHAVAARRRRPDAPADDPDDSKRRNGFLPASILADVPGAVDTPRRAPTRGRHGT